MIQYAIISISGGLYYIKKILEEYIDPSNDYIPNNVDKIDETKYLLLNKEYIDNIYKKIEKSTKDNIVVTIDDNIDLNHPKSVKGIIDTKIRTNNLENKIDSFFVPVTLNMGFIDKFQFINKNKDSLSFNDLKNYENTFENLRKQDNLTYLDDYIKPLANISKEQNKTIFINESFGSYIGFEEDKLNLDNKLSKFKNKIEKYDKDSKNLINFLNDTPNLFIAKSAGNNFFYKTGKLENEILSNNLNKLFDYDFKLLKEHSKIMNKLIELNIYGENVDEISKNYLDYLKFLCLNKNVDYESLIDLSIKDYLIHYQKFSLLEASKDLKNNNLFIVEATNYNKINNNLEKVINFYKDKINNLEEIKNKDIKTENDYKILKQIERIESNNKESIFKTLDKYEYLLKELKKCNFPENLNYSPEDIEKIKKFQNEFSKNFPEIFNISKYGTISNLNNQESKSFKISLEGQNTISLIAFDGTSSACPEFLSDLILKKLNHELELSDNFNSIK